jgi:hypothetical protein
VELVLGLCGRFDRAAAGHVQGADHLDPPVTQLGDGRRAARQHRACGRIRIERVGLALEPAGLAVRPVDLDHDGTLPSEVAGQPGTVHPGALHSDRDHATVLGRPPPQPAVARNGGRERRVTELTTDLVDDRGDMHLGMSVDPDGDLRHPDRVQTCSHNWHHVPASRSAMGTHQPGRRTRLWRA